MATHFEHLKHVLQSNLGPVAIQLYEQMLQEEQKIQEIEINYLRSQLERVHDDSAAELKRIEEERQVVQNRVRSVHQKLQTLQTAVSNASANSLMGQGNYGLGVLGGGGGGNLVSASSEREGSLGGGGFARMNEPEGSRGGVALPTIQFNPNAKAFEVRDDEWKQQQDQQLLRQRPGGNVAESGGRSQNWGGNQQQESAPNQLFSSNGSWTMDFQERLDAIFASTGNRPGPQEIQKLLLSYQNKGGASPGSQLNNYGDGGGFGGNGNMGLAASGWGEGGKVLAQQLAQAAAEQQQSRIFGGAKQGSASKSARPAAPVYSSIRLRGLPYNISADDLSSFLKGYGFIRESIRFGLTSDGRPSGEGWVSFLQHGDAVRAVKEKDRKHIGDRYVELFLQNPGERGSGDPGWEPSLFESKVQPPQSVQQQFSGQQSVGGESAADKVPSRKQQKAQQQVASKRPEDDGLLRSKQLMARAIEMGFDANLVAELLRSGEDLLFERLLEKDQTSSSVPPRRGGGIRLEDAVSNEAPEWTEVKKHKKEVVANGGSDSSGRSSPDVGGYSGSGGGGGGGGGGGVRNGRTASGHDICFNCGVAGHISRECPKPSRDNCYQCGKPGHVAKECREGDGRGQICREFLAGSCYRKNCKFKHAYTK